MSDDRRDLSSSQSDATLRDVMADDDGAVELSASDIEPLDSDEVRQVVVDAQAQPDPETTQVIEKKRIQANAAADAHRDESSLRSTIQQEAVSEATVSERTTDFDVPEELINEMMPTAEHRQRLTRIDSGEVVSAQTDGDQGCRTTKMKSVSTRPLPRVEPDTVERPADDEAFYSFVAQPDADGRIQLPDEWLSSIAGVGSPRVLVRVRVEDDAHE